MTEILLWYRKSVIPASAMAPTKILTCFSYSKDINEKVLAKMLTCYIFSKEIYDFHVQDLGTGKG